MRIATWNVNSVKQRVPRLLPWLDERRPDVVCLQETKLTDEAFPRSGTLGHAALLAVAELASTVRSARRAGEQPAEGAAAWVSLDDGALRATVAALLARHGRRWRNDYVEHPDRLLADVEDLLIAMRLLRRRDGALQLSALAHRYAPDVVEPTAPHTARSVTFPRRNALARPARYPSAQRRCRTVRIERL